MSYVRMLGSMTIAVIAAMACMGASVAMATEPNVTMCALDEALCEEENVIKPPAGGELVSVAESNYVQFGGTLGETCELSKMGSSTKQAMGSPLVGEVTSMLFSACAPCSTVTATGVPWKDVIGVYGSEFSREFIMNTVTMSFGCSLGRSCRFGASLVPLKAENTESGEPETLAEEESLSLEEGDPSFCGKSASWTSAYKVKWVELRDKEGKDIGKHDFWWSLSP